MIYYNLLRWSLKLLLEAKAFFVSDYYNLLRWSLKLKLLSDRIKPKTIIIYSVGV